MFIQFFFLLRQYGIKTSLMEYLHLLEALKQGLVEPDIEQFYYLSRTILIKHEGQLDAFDVLFGQYFQGKQGMGEDFWEEVPEEWLKAELAKHISPEDLEAIEKMGGLDALIQRFKELMAEQKKEHQGGNKWIGKGGTSPFGAEGYNPEGFSIGQNKGQHGNAIKIWNKRKYANLNDKAELNTRNIKLLLKRLRVLTREGAPTELDLKDTIRKTSENAGMLDIKMKPSRKNRVKVLMLFDVGGSMDAYVELCSQLFSAARYEFKQLEFFYFHNSIYEYVWKDNSRRHSEKTSVWELINKYNKDYKVIFVGDAAMSPIELLYKGGSAEHWNEEASLIWLQRMKNHFEFMAWINPTAEYRWRYNESAYILREFLAYRMFPMTLEGIQDTMKALSDHRIKHGSEADARPYQ